MQHFLNCDLMRSTESDQQIETPRKRNAWINLKITPIWVDAF